MPQKNVKNLAERCEAWVYDMYGRKLKGRCRNRRHIRINSKELCQRHACLESLHMAVKSGSAKLLPAKQPAMYGAVRTEGPES